MAGGHGRASVGLNICFYSALSSGDADLTANCVPGVERPPNPALGLAQPQLPLHLSLVPSPDRL